MVRSKASGSIVRTAAVAGGPGVGDEDVEAAEALDGARHRGLDGRAVGDVGLEPGGVGSAALRHPGELVGLQAHEREVRAAGGEPAWPPPRRSRAPRR